MVGNSTEVKNSLFFNRAQAPHFNYVGDSILGYKAHLGAGVILSNFKLLPENITVEMDGAPFDTGLRKFGALLGDGCEIGCNAVLSPGSIIGRALGHLSQRWPGAGILPDNMIVKNSAAQEVVVAARRGDREAGPMISASDSPHNGNGHDLTAQVERIFRPGRNTFQIPEF